MLLAMIQAPNHISKLNKIISSFLLKFFCFIHFMLPKHWQFIYRMFKSKWATNRWTIEIRIDKNTFYVMLWLKAMWQFKYCIGALWVNPRFFFVEKKAIHWERSNNVFYANTNSKINQIWISCKEKANVLKRCRLRYSMIWLVCVETVKQKIKTRYYFGLICVDGIFRIFYSCNWYIRFSTFSFFSPKRYQFKSIKEMYSLQKKYRKKKHKNYLNQYKYIYS